MKRNLKSEIRNCKLDWSNLRFRNFGFEISLRPISNLQERATIMLKQKKFIERVGTGSLPLLVLFLAAIPSVAQLPTGTILGVVKDSSGAVIPGTSLTITNIDTSLTRTGSSAEDGSYRFPALPVGRYRLEATKEGFSALTRTGITLEVAQEATVDVILEVGSATQTVTVFTFNNSSIIGTTAGVDGVKEYKVITSTPSAEYG